MFCGEAASGAGASAPKPAPTAKPQAAAAAAPAQSQSKPAAAPATPPQAQSAAQPSRTESSSNRTFASPLARRLAKEAGVGCCYIGWTGGEGISVAKHDETLYGEVSLADLREANERFFRDWMEG